MGIPQNGCFIMENTFKTNDSGVPWGTPISRNAHVFLSADCQGRPSILTACAVSVKISKGVGCHALALGKGQAEG